MAIILTQKVSHASLKQLNLLLLGLDSPQLKISVSNIILGDHYIFDSHFQQAKSDRNNYILGRFYFSLQVQNNVILTLLYAVVLYWAFATRLHYGNRFGLVCPTNWLVILQIKQRNGDKDMRLAKIVYFSWIRFVNDVLETMDDDSEEFVGLGDFHFCAESGFISSRVHAVVLHPVFQEFIMPFPFSLLLSLAWLHLNL